MATRTPNPRYRIAACAVALTAGGDLHLIPAGAFRGRDGRPKNVPAWRLDADIAGRLIARAAARQTRIVVDYEHQTLHAAKNGQPAPAAAWVDGARLEWRDGEGLFATGVDWTERAAAMVAAKEYLYLSPVFAYDDAGAVLDLLMIGLTNFPNLDGLDEVTLAVAANSFLSTQPTEENMDELLERLRWLLNLPIAATAEDVLAQLDKLKAQITEGNTATAANGADLLALLTENRARIAALTAQITADPDPAKYVPIASVQELHGQIAALTAQIGSDEAGRLIEAATADGRLPPALVGWAKDLGSKNIAALKGYLAQVAPVVPLGGTQTGGAVSAATPGELSETQMAVCRQMDVSPEDYRKTLADLAQG